MTLVLYVCMGQGHNSRSKGQIYPMLNRRLARTRTVRGAVATAVWTISVLYSLPQLVAYDTIHHASRKLSRPAALWRLTLSIRRRHHPPAAAGLGRGRDDGRGRHGRVPSRHLNPLTRESRGHCMV